MLDRVNELRQAAEVLGLDKLTTLSYPDGALGDVSVDSLEREVLEAVNDAQSLLTFDVDGVTGHPDHCAVTQATVLAGEKLGVPVIAWAIDEDIAQELNSRFGTTFKGRAGEEMDVQLTVDRARQLDAVRCHVSQENPVMRARLDLQGDREWLRWLRPPLRQ